MTSLVECSLGPTLNPHPYTLCGRLCTVQVYALLLQHFCFVTLKSPRDISQKEGGPAHHTPGIRLLKPELRESETKPRPRSLKPRTPPAFNRNHSNPLRETILVLTIEKQNQISIIRVAIEIELKVIVLVIAMALHCGLALLLWLAAGLKHTDWAEFCNRGLVQCQPKV